MKKWLTLSFFISLIWLVGAQGNGAYYGWKIIADAPNNFGISYQQTYNGDIFAVKNNDNKIYKLDINTGDLQVVFTHQSDIEYIYSNPKDQTNSLYYLQQGGSTSTYQLQVSTDGGNTFSLLSNVADQFGGGIYKTNNGTIISFSPDRISFSTDGGQNFTNWTTNINASMITEGPDGKIYVAAMEGLFVTNGINQTFTKLNIAPHCVNYVRVTNDGNIYFQHGTLNTSNNTCLTSNAYNFGMSSNDGQSADFNNLFNAAGPSNYPLQMIEGINNAKWLNNNFNYGLFFFQNYPDFSQVISGINNNFRNIEFLAVEPSGRLIAISEGYIFASHYSIYQPQYFEELNTESVSQIKRLTSGNMIASVDNATKLKTSSNDGASFSNEILNLSSGNSIVDFEVMENGKILAAHTPGYLKYSDDEGQTWNTAYFDNQNVNIADISVKNDWAVLTRKGSVYYSVDGASTWNEKYMYAAITSNPTLSSTLITQNNTILVGQIYTNGGGYIYRSVDTLQTLIELPQPIIAVSEFAQASDGTIYAASDDGLYLSNDDGSTWIKDMHCPLIDATAVCVRANGDVEISGTDSVNHFYTFRKKENESDWKFHILPLPYTIKSTNHFFDDPITGKLYVGGLWRSIFPEPTPVSILNKTNSKVEELIIFPNPSKGNTYIKGLEKSGNFKLKIVDLNGKIIYNEEIQVDNNDILLPSIDVKGMYLVIIQNGQYNWMGKWLNN